MNKRPALSCAVEEVAKVPAPWRVDPSHSKADPLGIDAVVRSAHSCRCDLRHKRVAPFSSVKSVTAHITERL